MNKKSSMADNRKFSDFAIQLIKSEAFTGESMIATSRAILDSSYSDEEYDQDFMNIFILIDDEAGEVIIDGFHPYNIPSKRYNVGGNPIEKFINVATGGLLSICPGLNMADRENIISYLYSNYRDIFLESIDAVIAKYEL